MANKVSPDKVIFNLSDKVLSPVEKRALSNGLKYAIYPGKLNFARPFLCFETLFKVMSGHALYDPCAKGFSYVKSSLRQLANWYYYSHENKPGVNNLDKDEMDALKVLSNDHSIVITKPDKGQGVVLLNKSDYVSKMLAILNDNSKFRKVTGDIFSVILKYEDKLNRCLRKLKDLCIIDDNVFSWLYASGSKPGVMYGLPKVHKNDNPLRPILSAIGTFNYNLSKFFVPILASFTTNQFTVPSFFDFVKEITNLNYNECFIASFDITSLFTNIPLAETIDICINKLFDGIELVRGFNKQQCLELLRLAVEENVFIFDKTYYKQHDGVGMGFPLGCTLANLFLCHHESEWLRNVP